MTAQNPVTQIYFVRHGPAGDGSTWQGADADRPLTSKGRRTVHDVSRSLAHLGVAPEVVVTSPYVRASETAQLLVEGLGLKVAVASDERLTTALGVSGVRSILHDNGDVSVIMLVGHAPHLSDAIGALCGGARVALKKGGVARVDLDDLGEGVLSWLAQPDQLLIHG